MPTTALTVHGLRKRYGKRWALDGLDLDVPCGSLFGLVGSNGAGKTTMMTCCAGLLQADGGMINLLGSGSPDPDRLRGRYAILPQDARLPLHARVGELMFYYARLIGLAPAEARRQIGELLEWVNLADRRDAAVRTLSHGMMRRLTVAQAFLGHPELVFLDEPMSGLDPREVNRLRDLLTRRPAGQTIVISSHILGELEMICDHVAFVEKGKRVKQGPLSAMVRRHHRLTYRLRPGGWPEESLRALPVKATWSFVPEKQVMEVMLDDEPRDPVEVNALILRVLLEAGVGIEEVTRGSDLEREFLHATATGP